MFSLHSRPRPELRYRALELEVTADLLRALADGCEISSRSRPMGWLREETRDELMTDEACESIAAE